MTWRTPSGDRTLEGSEAALVTAILSEMHELLDEEAHEEAGQWTYGVRLFDELSWPQRLNLLVVIGEALFRPEVPSPSLSAVYEAALGALCKAVDQELRIELDHAKNNPETLSETSTCIAGAG